MISQACNTGFLRKVEITIMYYIRRSIVFCFSSSNNSFSNLQLMFALSGGYKRKTLATNRLMCFVLQIFGKTILYMKTIRIIQNSRVDSVGVYLISHENHRGGVYSQRGKRAIALKQNHTENQARLKQKERVDVSGEKSVQKRIVAKEIATKMTLSISFNFLFFFNFSL